MNPSQQHGIRPRRPSDWQTNWLPWERRIQKRVGDELWRFSTWVSHSEYIHWTSHCKRILPAIGYSNGYILNSFHSFANYQTNTLRNPTPSSPNSSVPFANATPTDQAVTPESSASNRNRNTNITPYQRVIKVPSQNANHTIKPHPPS